MDFLKAEGDQRLVDYFPEDQFPGQQETWSFFAGESEPPFLDFSATTSGHGTLRFDVSQEK